MRSRWWLLSAVLIASLFILSACGGAGRQQASSGGSGPSGQLVVGTWGGDYQKFLQDYVGPDLARTAPNVNVVFATGMHTERMTKMRAEKGGPGTFDVVGLADTDMQKMINEGLLAKLNPEKIPNWDDIHENLRNEYYVPHIFSASVLIYNENKVQPAPTSWAVLWDPKYKGKIGIQDVLWLNWLQAAAALEGKPNDLDSGWERIMALKNQEPKIYSSQEALGAALQTGEVWLTISWRARAVQWNNAGGEPLGNVVPKEGSFPVVFGMAIPANAKNPDAAYAYLNALLEPDAQAGFAEKMGYAPTVKDANLPKDLQETIAFTEEELKRIKPLDLNYVAQNDPRWKEKWDKEFIGGQ